jgi:hypothetical protein
LIPKYTKIKFGNSSPAAIVTTKKAQITRIKDEIIFLFKKKEKLNYELYKAHLMAAQEWGSVWDTILRSIHESLNCEMERKYKALDAKIGKLTQTQVNNHNTDIQFCPRVINKTNIPFDDEELSLLNKGLKYNLNQKRKHWLSDLAFEAETAVTLLPPANKNISDTRLHIICKSSTSNITIKEWSSIKLQCMREKP